MGTYAKSFEIPAGFPSILREFAKEAIREQPEDIYQFGYEYFEKLCSGGNVEELFEDELPNVGTTIEDEDMGVITLGVHQVATQESGKVRSTAAEPDTKLQDALSDRISMLFQEADADGNGTLSRKEFSEVFELIGSEIGLTSRDVLQIMAQADNNDDGVIEYREFMPIAMEIIQAIMAKEEYSNTKIIREKRGSAKLEVKDYLMKGLPRHELEESIQEIFRGADGDNSGALDRSEFLRCLRESGLGFTREELNLILTLIDKNGDGVIDYQEFMPVCFSMIVQTLSEKAQEIPAEEANLRADVHKILFTATGGAERLTASAASQCLREAGLGLRFVQIHAIMSEVQEGEDGLMATEEVANAVAGVMCALKQLHMRQNASIEDETVIEFRTARKTENLAKVAGLTADEFTEKLMRVLKTKDAENEGSLASKDVFREAVKEAFPELAPQQVHALNSLLEQKAEGKWGYDKVGTWGFRTLQELVGQKVLMHSMNYNVSVE